MSALKEIMTITVYKDTVFPGHLDDDNLIDIDIKKDVLFSWFKENILDSFRGDDESVSDEGLLEEWLDEYTADDTDSLYQYAVENYGQKSVHNK